MGQFIDDDDLFDDNEVAMLGVCESKISAFFLQYKRCVIDEHQYQTEAKKKHTMITICRMKSFLHTPLRRRACKWMG